MRTHPYDSVYNSHDYRDDGHDNGLDRTRDSRDNGSLNTKINVSPTHFPVMNILGTAVHKSVGKASAT